MSLRTSKQSSSLTSVGDQVELSESSLSSSKKYLHHPDRTIPKQLNPLPQLITLIIASILSVIYYHTNGTLYGLLSSVANVQSSTGRLVLAVRLLVFSVIPIFVSLFHVFHCRISNGTAALNPLSGNEHLVEKANRILHNTVEQILLHIINLLVFSVIIPPGATFMIRYIVFLFTVGRLIYWAGYTLNPVHRSPGFILTFLPTMIVFGYNLARVNGLI